MPLRPLNREQAWMLPPTLGELIPNDHPARFIAEFVDALDHAAWIELGIGPDGEPLGAPAYHPRALLCVWLHGFMTGIRSSRELEAACRDQVPYLYLTGWQHPDHNTLWRFYQAHRDAMRKLLKYTVATAVELDLIDLAVQAVDGTKIAANAADDRTYDAADLQRLFNRTEAAISELEAQNEGGDDSPPSRLPEELQTAKKLQQRVKDAMNRLAQQEKIKRVNLTDEDAQLMKGRSGIITGYNALAVLVILPPLPSLDPLSRGQAFRFDYIQLLRYADIPHSVLNKRKDCSLTERTYVFIIGFGQRIIGRKSASMAHRGVLTVQKDYAGRATQTMHHIKGKVEGSVVAQNVAPTVASQLQTSTSLRSESQPASQRVQVGAAVLLEHQQLTYQSGVRKPPR